jgi:superfamily II DNA or RNA helicase
MTEAELLALHLVARGRLLPTVTEEGYAAWRVGPLDPSDVDRMRRLGIRREQLDAVADRLAREPGATSPFADPVPHHVPELRDWADAIAAEHDRTARVSLRIETTGDDLAFTAVLQVHRMALPESGRVLPNRTSGERDATQPQARDQAEPSFPNATNTVNPGEAEQFDAATVWTGTDFDHQERLDAMLEVRHAAQVWAPLTRLLEVAVPDQLELTDAEVRDLLGDGGQALAAAGIPVHWPRELDRDVTAAAVVGGDEIPPFFDGLLDFSWQVALGGDPLGATEMDQLAEAHRPVVRLRDRWTLVPPDLARKARERVLKPLTAVEALGAALTGRAEVDGEWVPVAPSRPLELLRERLSVPDDVPQPAALTATLRDYQLRGLRWLARMTELGLGGCLADDMGLGKTITLIALHLHRGTGPTLVVCPASLLGNWEREIHRFAPDVPVHRYHGGDRSIVDTDGFVLTTYGTMRLDAEALSTVSWDLVVADEAQHVKNPRSETAKALRHIPAHARVALTGTPVENNLSELWAILDWTTPGLLGTLGEFRSRWAQRVESGEPGAAERLSRLVRPFLLRRRKSDPGIAPELPPKTETDQPVALTREQAGLYEAVVRETMTRIRESTGMRRRGLVLKLLTALKQVCNHPAQYLRETDTPLSGRSGKLELLDELVDTIRAEGGGLLVFTQYVAMARLLARHLEERGVPTQLLHGGTPVRQRDELVRQFQESTEPPVFLLSLKAAGTGLNLTRADHVVHYDRWWNPAVEAQATDRAYRIGQDRPVQVHRLIAEGTLEDRIAAMLESKKELADAVLGAQEGLTELTDTELADLVELRGMP